MNFLSLYFVKLPLMSLLNNKHSRRWTVLLAGLVVVIGSTVWMEILLKSARERLMRDEQQLAQLPQTQARTAAQESEISKRQRDVDRIESFVVQQKDQLSQVVSEIEAIGTKRGLLVHVPAVEEKIPTDESGQEIPPTGPLSEVRLKITVTGSAKDLLAFLHEVEHTQRLTYFESWRLDGSEQTARNQAAILGRQTAQTRSVSLLLADLIVAVRRGEEEKP